VARPGDIDTWYVGHSGSWADFRFFVTPTHICVGFETFVRVVRRLGCFARSFALGPRKVTGPPDFATLSEPRCYLVVLQMTLTAPPSLAPSLAQLLSHFQVTRPCARFYPVGACSHTYFSIFSLPSHGHPMRGPLLICPLQVLYPVSALSSHVAKRHPESHPTVQPHALIFCSGFPFYFESLLENELKRPYMTITHFPAPFSPHFTPPALLYHLFLVVMFRFFLGKLLNPVFPGPLFLGNLDQPCFHPFSSLNRVFTFLLFVPLP